MNRLFPLLGLLVVGALGGSVAAFLGLPLAWLIGSAVVAAAVSLSLRQIAMPRVLYRTGQVVVGVAVGLTVSADIVDRLGAHFFLIPAVALASIGIGRFVAPFLVWFGDLDRPTAFFSTVPAGISEMAELSARHGADVGAVATFHALRVFLVVLLLPPVILLASPAQGALDLPDATGSWSPALLFSLLTGLVAALLGNALGLASAFFIGPMVAVAGLSGANLVAASEPGHLLAGAQVLLGASIGTRFNRQTLQRLPKALLVGVPVVLAHATLMAVLATAVSMLVGLQPPLMLLCLATGGAAEMVLTARLVATDVALVALYQVARGLLGNLLAEQVYLRTGFVPANR